MIENIKLKFNYRSQSNNGWPMIMIKINDRIMARFEANSDHWSGDFDVPMQPTNSLRIEHYGKNYIADQSPDKYFELEKFFINDVDLKHHIFLFKQTAYLAPWDTIPPQAHSFYLGHNGYLELIFDSPVDSWIQRLFGVTSETMHGQSTSYQVLEDVKQFFGIR